MAGYLKRRIWSLIRLSPKIKNLLTTSIIVIILFELIKIVPPFIFKEIIDTMIAFDPLNPSIYSIGLLVGAYFLSMSAMTAMEVIGSRIMYTRIRFAENDVAKRILAKLFALDLKYHEDHNTGESISKIVKGISRLVDLMFNLIDRLLPICFQAMITLIIVFWMSWEVGLSYLLFVPIFAVLLIRDSRSTQALREQYHVRYDQFAGAITQSMTNIRTVKDFHNEQKEIAKADTFLKKYVDLMIQRTKIGLKNMMLEDSLVNLARATTLLISVWLMMNFRITAGELVFIMTLTEKAYINLTRLSRVYFHVQDVEPAIDRFNEILDEDILIKENVDAKEVITKGKLEFKNVSFSYGQKEHALKNVSFNIEPKQVVAFVGRSGSGKTTVMKLLLRQFDIDDGSILVDGTDIREYSFKNLRKSTAIVSQDVELFNESILKNIAYGVEKTSRKEIVRAAKMAHAHEFITQFKDGYNTVVGEQGIRLSGGQKQRIAIARALLMKPKILIFDEATSSLDSESEQCIHKSIVNLVGKVTLIIIAHRFATIEHAEKIILLEQGKLKEMGTHKELMKKKGIFAKLRSLQKLGEIM